MNKILIAEDDDVQAKFLILAFKENGFKTECAKNGKEALDLFIKDPNVILVTDLSMPEMDGEELIKKVKEIDEDVLIIVQTTIKKPDHIIQIMKLGVYDYLIKPVDAHELAIKIKRTTEAFELRKMKRNLEKEKIARLESQIEWYQYKDKFNNSKEYNNKTDIHQSLFHNLRQNFAQGVGIGVLSSMAGLFKISPKNENGDTIITSDLIDLIIENDKIVQRALNKFEEIESLIYKEIPLEKISGDDVYKLVNEEKWKANKYKEIRNNEIIISDSKPKFKQIEVLINKDLFSKVIFELILNAFKFSKEKSKVIILVDIVNSNLNFTFINESTLDQKGRIGIPEEYQNLIFEPFFRLSIYTNEKYETLDYGLGLTFVDKVVNRHKGTIKVNNIKVHSISQDTPTSNVEIIVSIPIIK